MNIAGVVLEATVAVMCPGVFAVAANLTLVALSCEEVQCIITLLHRPDLLGELVSRKG